VGSAALLAIDSERLQAEVRAQLVELLAARRRIVAAADGARQQVERTIHDDVQAELMGALLQLGQVRSSAEEAGEDARAREAAGIAEEVRTLVSHLRDFSRGVYPAVLDASGLGAALDALADEAPVALRIHCGVDGGASVEALRATYLLVLDAATRATGDLDVRVDALEGLLGLAIVGHPGGVREDLSDRVGALGGTISVDAGTLRVVLPCA
jgi:signal transduction histidine kinase